MDLAETEVVNNSTVLKSRENLRQQMLQNENQGDVSHQFLIEYTDKESNEDHGEILVEKVEIIQMNEKRAHRPQTATVRPKALA
jgi:hypothetical protein